MHYVELKIDQHGSSNILLFNDCSLIKYPIEKGLHWATVIIIRILHLLRDPDELYLILCI